VLAGVGHWLGLGAANLVNIFGRPMAHGGKLNG
jgi:hypothetical protein